ncbi:MAG: TlpA family protein disulfide reductase [Blastocatellia bacterium]
MKKNTILTSLLVLSFIALTANSAGELVRFVRLKLSAGDLASAVSAVEYYKEKHGVDTEYLDAVGWLARGAEMLKQPDAAAAYVAELRREIREEKPDLVIPLGAAIEVEGKLRATREGRGSALRFLEEEFARAKDVALRSRIRKNINLLSLEGQPAPDLNKTDFIGTEPPSIAALKGKPALLFLWAHWCGDCTAQAGMLGRVTRKYRAQGLVVIAPTRYYGTGAGNKPATPAEEKAHMAKVWAEVYAGLEGVSIPIDTDTMAQYGASSTPTYALIDRKGMVRFYSPTRLSEAELSRRIEAVLAEAL